MYEVFESEEGRGERRGEGTKEKERFGKERAGKRGGGGHTGRRDVLDGEGTQRRKLNEERARERERAWMNETDRRSWQTELVPDPI